MTTPSNSIPHLPTNSVLAIPGLQDDPSSRKGKSEESTACSSSDKTAPVPVQLPPQPSNPSISNGSGDSSPGKEERSNAVTSATSMSAISSMANITTVPTATTTATISASVPLKVPSLARQIRPSIPSSIPPTIQIRPSLPASRPIPIASRPPISTPSSQSAPTPPSAPLATHPHFSSNDSSINGVVQSLTGQALMGAQMTRMPITINVMPRNQPLMRPRLPMHQVGSGRPGQGMSLQVNPSLGSSVSLAPTLPLQSRPSLLPQATIRPTTPASTTPLQSAHPTLLGMPMGMMLPTTPAPAHSQSASCKSAGVSAFSKTALPTSKQTLSPAHSQTATPAPNQSSGSKPGPLPLHSHPSSPVAKLPTVPSSQPSLMGKLPLPPSPAQQFMAMGGRTCPLGFSVGSRPSSSTVAVSLAGKATPGVVSSIPFSATSLVPIVSKPGGSLAPASRPTLVATPMNVSIAGGQTVTVLTQASLPMGSSLPGGPVQGPLLIAGSPVSLSQAGVSLPQPPPLLPISTVPASVGMAATATPASSISLPHPSQPTPILLSDGVPTSVSADKEREFEASENKQTESASYTTPSEPAANVGNTATKTEQLFNEGVAQESGDFDAIGALKWDGDIGLLPGSDLKFRINTMGMIEMVMEDVPDLDTSTPTSTAESPASTGPYPKHVLTDDPSLLKPVEGDKVARCEGCRRYGYASLFLGTSRFCSQACVGIHAGRKNASKKALQVKPLHNIKKRKKSSVGAASLDEEDSMGPSGAKMSKLESFNWNSYLAEQKAVGAPVKLFKEPFPPVMRNSFKKGMKLEGVDPCHQSLYCVLTVAEVMGFRLRLHFDGYSECYDFWVNADSPFIFPAGWCEKNGKKLTPPKNYIQSGEQFSWILWMKNSKGIIAAKYLFINQPATSVTPNAFRVGMKLEAVDKKNAVLICVATVNDTLGDKVLIHFDGWDNSYDYWCDISSPYIHPVGWCQENGHALSPPADWTEVETFTWEDYLAQTKSSAVPARAFKPRPPVGFAVGQRLEVVDKRNPILVRVATVADVDGHRIKIHFDGWSSGYDYWLDDDSPDLHPPGWCLRTGHDLQPPITPGENNSVRSSQSGCPTQGCRGIGHIKGAKYTGHHSDFGCPYSAVNMNKETTLQDRLGGNRNDDGLTPPGTIRIKREISNSPELSDAENTNSSGAHSHLALTAWSNPPEKRKRGRPKSSWRKALEEKSRIVSSGFNWNEKCPTPGCNGEGHVTGRFTAHHRVSGCPLAEHQQSFKLKSFGPGRGRKRSRFLSVDSRCDGEDRDRGEDSHSSEISGSDNTAHLQNGIHQSIFMPAMTPSPGRELSLCWEQHAKLLPEVGETTSNEVQAWSIQDVANFIQTLPGCQEQARVFAEEQIDGEAFLLLNQSDIVKILNVKLGPALKIYNSILMFRNA